MRRMNVPIAHLGSMDYVPHLMAHLYSSGNSTCRTHKIWDMFFRSRIVTSRLGKTNIIGPLLKGATGTNMGLKALGKIGAKLGLVLGLGLSIWDMIEG